MSREGLVSLSRRPSYVEIQGRTLTVPWTPASTWLAVLSAEPRTAALVLAEDGRDLFRGVARGSVPLAEVERASHRLLTGLTGRPWYEAERLAVTSMTEDVIGELTIHGVDPERVGIGEWTAATYRVLTRDADAKGRNKLDLQLGMPPDGPDSAWDDGEDVFADAMRAERALHRERAAQRG